MATKFCECQFKKDNQLYCDVEKGEGKAYPCPYTINNIKYDTNQKQFYISHLDYEDTARCPHFKLSKTLAKKLEKALKEDSLEKVLQNLTK